MAVKPSLRARQPNERCTVSASHTQSGRTFRTASRAAFQKASGTKEATSQRNPSTIPAQ